ncbi:hypothetical protein Athai_13560 [Actinocatenispora thailandica]|uniref:Carrier domain-containing protein n=1 Tax=Actinocatenispora thailandica TaxID=227318 RepID=A0A7R7DLK4_9ACTN|nr:non-ribosomal peptide synthetase [Actinocatenispora thailandica]BCJ33853.1 hypothetical protein Athai_13560 [Actinocatenispora thailandica]
MPLLHKLVAEAARRQPDATAVVDGAQKLTFGEMEGAAASVAAGLRTLGVRRGDRVVVAMRRGINVVPVLLGILKTGAGFVPHDVDTPTPRLELVATDAGAPVVITEPDLLARWSGAVQRVRFTDVTQLLGTPADCATVDAGQLTGADLAYVLYTSGSTGRPKGVAISHDGITNYLAWAVEFYDMASGTGAPLFTSIAFDLTLTSLFGPLLAGRAVTVVPEAEALPALAELLCAGPDFSFIKLTPQHLDLLVELIDSRVDQAVRCVIVGGDALHTSSVRRWLERAHSSVVNEYGPTETVVGCVVHRVPPTGPVAAHGPVPIGKPVARAGAYVLGPGLEPVPTGEVGELYVGGVCATGWYLDQPALTAQRFLPDPFGPPGGRMYRTGDRVRTAMDGQLVYLGRVDHQVKVRGHRVEPAEVQAVLRSHPLVSEAIVLARTAATGRGNSGGVELVAAVVGEARPDGLGDWLRERLPEWMVPARIVPVDGLPLTGNGKVDRAAVLELAARSLDGDASAVVGVTKRGGPSNEPRYPREALLAGLMSEVLNRDQVDPDDSFYGLGGDSIHAIRLVARARKAGLGITVRDVVDNPTPARLAAVAVAARSGQIASSAAAGTGPVPLTPIQQWFFELDLAEPGYWNQSVLLDLPPGTDAAAMECAVTHVTAVHDALRLRFERTADGWTQQLSSGPARVAFSVVDLSDVDVKGREAAFAGSVAAAHAALGLRDGPLLRAVLVRGSGPDADRLLLVAHHLVVDTVSWQILVDDLEQMYDQARRGLGPEMPAPANQFTTWARACADVGARVDVMTPAVRWRESMPTGTAGVPRDDPTAVNDLAGRAEFNATLPAERVDMLVGAIGESGLRLPELLLGSFVAALCAVLGGPPPMVHVEGHGREDLGLELDVTRTVGWFTSLYPVHLGDDREPAALVWAAREAIRSAPMSGLGYGLARYVGRAPELVADPVPELLFNYLGRSEALVNRAMGWRLSDASSGPPTGKLGVRPYLLEYHPRIVSGTLRSTVVYHADCHRRSTVESIATGIHDLLSQPELLAKPPDTIRYADAGLTTDELERILARYDRRST